MILHQTEKLDVIFADGGLTELAGYLKATPRRWAHNYSYQSPPSSSWDLNTSYDAAWRLADTGWTEGALNMANQLAILPPNEAEPEYSYDVAGYMPDVPLYCAGEPMHMMNYGHPEGRKPVVHLVINGWVLCTITAQEYRNYGAAIAAMIQQIEATGRQCEVDMIFAGNQPRNRVVLGWKVKRAGDNMDFSALSYSVAHPAAFRRIGFALIERSMAKSQNAGYGSSASFNVDDARIINAEGAFLLGGIGGSAGACNTMTGALKFAAKEINKAAGEELVTVRD